MPDIKISGLTAVAELEEAAFFEVSNPANTPGSKKLAATFIPTIVKDIAAGDETTALTTGTKVTFRWKGRPVSKGLKISASLTTAQASGAQLVTVDVKKNGTSMFSTKPTFDNTEKTTETASAAAVLSATSIAYDDEITVIVDALQSGSVAAGLKVYIEGRV